VHPRCPGGRVRFHPGGWAPPHPAQLARFEIEGFEEVPFNPDETAPLDVRWSMPSLQGEEHDLEDLLSISVTEVTVSLPRYRPPQTASAALPAPHPPPVEAGPATPPPPGPLPARPSVPQAKRSVVGPGRRLR